MIGIITGHDPSVPLFLYYPMHLVHSPLCVPEGYIERFDFIRDADDNINHDRQCKPSRPLSLRSLLTRLKEMCVRADVAAMVNYLDDVVGNVATALKDAGLWENTLMVWSSGATDRQFTARTCSRALVDCVWQIMAVPWS